MRVRDLPPHLQAYARAALGQASPPSASRRNRRALPDPAADAPQDWPPLVLVAPMPPTLTNSGLGRSRHWRAARCERQELWDSLDLLLAARRIPAPPSSPFRRVWLRSSMTLGAAMDDDNAVARHKHLIDWLVSTGYLASDRRTCLRWVEFPTQRVTRSEPATITLTITPRED